MKSPYQKLVMVVMALCAMALAAADDLADFKKWYIGEQATMKKAFESKNMSYFAKTSTPDFTYKEFNGRVTNKKESLDGMQQMMNMTDKVKFNAKIGAIKATKAGMTVDVVNKFDLRMKPGADKKVHTMSVQSTSRETWVKKGGKWLLKNITDTAANKMMMDGKPMPAGAGG